MNNKEIAERVVSRMLDTIKAEGQLPWTKPWHLDKNRVRVIDGYTEITVPVRFWSRSGKPYNGINVLLLGMSGHTGEFITKNINGADVKLNPAGYQNVLYVTGALYILALVLCMVLVKPSNTKGEKK